MNIRLMKLLKLHRLMEANDGNGNDLGGGGDETGDTGHADDKAKTGGDDAGNGDPDAGKSKISDTEAKLLKEVMSKKNALTKANDELAAAKTRLAEFDGIDPNEVRELLKAKKEAENAQLEAKGQWDRLKSQMAEEHGKEKSLLLQRAAEAEAKNAQLISTIAELTVGSAFSGSEFVKSDLSIPVSKVRALYGSHFEFKDGNIVGFDKPAGAADRTMLVNSSGEPLSFEDALKKVIDSDPDRDQLLKSKMKAGAGSSTQTKAMPDKKVVELRGIDRISAALSSTK